MRSPVTYLLRKGAMGDVLWMEPVIRSLAATHKKVVVVTHYGELFNHYPLKNVSFAAKLPPIEKVLYWLEKLLKIQCRFINLKDAYEVNPGVHLVLAYFMKAKQRARLTYPSLYLSDDEKARRILKYSRYVVLHVERYVHDLRFRNIVGIDWPRIVCDLRALGLEVVQIGKRENQIDGVEFVNASLRDLIVLINQCCFFIGPDSGPAHIAATLRKPAIILFGSIDPWLRHIKHQFRGIMIQGNCVYAGCYHLQRHGDQTCLIEGDEPTRTPPCSVHSTDRLKQSIRALISHFDLEPTSVLRVSEGCRSSAGAA
jgi:ADP-heptose:LPS heptosyltransferase